METRLYFYAKKKRSKKKGGENILIENQKIIIKWAHKTKKHYIDKGYKFTEYGDTFCVTPKDLPAHSCYKVEVECDYCHRVFTMAMNTYSKARSIFPKDACKKCAAFKGYENNYEKRKNDAFDKLEDFCTQKNYILITPRNEYSDAYMKITYICPKHGEQNSMLTNMLSGHGCIKCQYDDISKMQIHDSDYVESYINNINENILLNKEDYVGTRNKNLKILCGLCGKNVFITSFDSYKSKGVNTCCNCSNRCSKAELRIHKLLTSLEIDYIAEKTFPDCKNIRRLMFDFYLPKYNLLIEYDGEGHYLESFYKNRTEDTKLALENAQKKDKIKTDYCVQNNIPLLRIPYTQKDDLEEIILNKIKQLDNNFR